MIRSLLRGLRLRSQPTPRSAKEIQDDLRRCLAERRLLEKQVAEEVKVCAERSFEMDRLMEEFVRRVDNARMDSGRSGKSDKKILKKCWTVKERDANIAMRESQNLVTIRRKSLQEVNQKICRLHNDLVAAVKRESQDLPFGHEQLDVEVFLPPIPQNAVDQVSSTSCNQVPKAFDQRSLAPTVRHASVPDQTVVDWEAKMDAAHRKFQASSARCHQLAMEFDERLIKPMEKRIPYFGSPLDVNYIPDEWAEAQCSKVHPQLHAADRKKAPGLLMLEEFLEAIVPVENVTALVSDAKPVEPIAESLPVPATVHHASGQNVVDWEAKLDAAHQKFLASSARCCQLVKDFDKHLIEPMKKRSPCLGVPPEVDCRQ